MIFSDDSQIKKSKNLPFWESSEVTTNNGCHKWLGLPNVAAEQVDDTPWPKAEGKLKNLEIEPFDQCIHESTSNLG